MAVSAKPKTSFPFQDFFQESLDKISETQIIHLIVKDFDPKREVVASRQIKIYLKKIMSHPSMRPVYITKIKQLIQFEKNMVKKRYE